MNPSHRPDKFVLQVARRILAEAAQKPWLASLLAQHKDWLDKLRVHIQRLPRPERLGLWRKLASGMAAAVLLASLVGAPPVYAAGGVVGNGTPGSCTEVALETALASGGTVTFNCGGPATINFTSQKTLTTSKDINGYNNGDYVVFSGGDAFALFYLSGPAVFNFDYVTFEHTRQISGGSALTILSATVGVNHSTFHNNVTTGGGGSAILSSGASVVTIDNSTFDANSGVAQGAISLTGTTSLTLRNSTMTGNSAAYGGALYMLSGTSAAIINSTITGNSGTTRGGGIYSYGSVTLQNSIIADQAVGGNCVKAGGTFTSNGYNIESANSCGFNQPTDLIDVADVGLLTLAANGGATQTIALASGSMALEWIPAGTNGCGTAPLDKDQRGEARPGTKNGTGKCEVGAWEAQTADPTQVALQSFTALAHAPQGALAALVALVGGALAALAVRFSLRSKI